MDNTAVRWLAFSLIFTFRTSLSVVVGRLLASLMAWASMGQHGGKIWPRWQLGK